MTGFTAYAVDTELQGQFFAEVDKQLQKVQSFFTGMMVGLVICGDHENSL